MAAFSLQPRPHGPNDIGYRVSQPGMLVHYYMSTDRSHVAITHCNLIALKDNLIECDDETRCQYCGMVEDMRTQLDGQNV